jgi:hypothetical protein
VPHPPKDLASRRPVWLAVCLVLAACAADKRTMPLLELGFGAGVRVPAAEDDETPLVTAQAAVGAVSWSTRGEAPFQQHLGLGGVFTLESFDLERTDVGADLILAPPRLSQRTGFQFRLGGRVSADGDHAGSHFAAEWADVLVGALFASAQYDFVGDEASFLFGARVNLFFPVTYVRATPLALE